MTLGNFLHKHKDCAEKFIWSKQGINRKKCSMFYFHTAYFSHFFLNQKRSLQNSLDLLNNYFQSLAKAKAGHLHCLHFINDSHMVTFWNLVQDQCDVTHWADYRPAMTIAVDLVRKATKPTNNQTHWAEVGDAKLADFNFTSFTLVTIFKVGCWIWIEIYLQPNAKKLHK